MGKDRLPNRIHSYEDYDPQLEEKIEFEDISPLPITSSSKLSGIGEERENILDLDSLGDIKGAKEGGAKGAGKDGGIRKFLHKGKKVTA